MELKKYAQGGNLLLQNTMMESEAILNQLLALKEMKIEDLINKYADLFDDKRPGVNNAGYLRKKIAYRIQENAHGGLSESAEARLNQLITVYDPINNKLLRKVKADKQSSTQIIRDRRLPIPGSIITKIYKGIAIKVTVLEKGFEYDGKTYRTLSHVANVITGDHWNGYLFFNL